MKSRVLNTTHLHQEGNIYIGYTDELKPSLFNTNKKIHRDESFLWIQNKESMKMSYWIQDETQTIDTDEKRIWVYIPQEKFIHKFPELEGQKLIIIWRTGKWKFLSPNPKISNPPPKKPHKKKKLKLHQKRRLARFVYKEQKLLYKIDALKKGTWLIDGNPLPNNLIDKEIYHTEEVLKKVRSEIEKWKSIGKELQVRSILMNPANEYHGPNEKVNISKRNPKVNSLKKERMEAYKKRQDEFYKKTYKKEVNNHVRT